MKGTVHLEDVDIDLQILDKKGVMAQTAFKWLRIKSDGGLL
jgi:hypothetical protein